MHDTKRPIVIVGNWKMYKTIDEATAFLHELSALQKKPPARIYLSVPFTVISSLVQEAEGSSIVIGAQNMHDASEGAFTGEIAAKMLTEAGAHFVILGHSERRKIFKEDNAFINRKLKKAIESGLQPILCVGETLEEHQAGKGKEIVLKQLEECLKGIKNSQLKDLILAYEPVWAVGTDVPATPEIAEEMHKTCREWLQDHFGEDVSQITPILYGGSVKPDNAKFLLEQPDVDGLLVGGASLNAKSFSQIINAAKECSYSQEETV